MLQRIAKVTDRRLPDLAQLLFADGLFFFFAEECVYVKKEENEFTKAEKDQLAINKPLIEEGYYHLSDEEQAKTAFKKVEKGWQNFGPTETEKYGFDNLIVPMAERIKSIALN